MMEKQDLASARRRLRGTNLKSRKRALKILHDARRNASKAKEYQRTLANLANVFLLAVRYD